MDANDTSTYRIGDTATSAAIAWLNDNCVGSRNGPTDATAVFPTSPLLIHQAADAYANADASNNFSQLSVTMTEEDLLNLKSSRNNAAVLAETKESRVSSSARSCESSSLLPTRRTVSPPPSLPRPSRKMGRHEILYRQQYQDYVSTRIQNFRSEHGLPDYRSMTRDQQSREQKRVLELLERLRMVSMEIHDVRIPGSPALTNQSRRSEDDRSTVSDETTQTAPSGQSMCLLSPPLPKESAMAFPRDEFSEASSIENVRATQYTSPDYERFEKKRVASTSGKRGADMSRLRLDSDDVPLSKSIGRLTLGDDHIFTSSQSPIATMASSPIRSTSSDGDEDVSDPMETQPDISFGSDTLLESKKYDHDSVVETAMLPDKKVRWDFEGLYEKEAPTDVRLRQGALFHLPTILAGSSGRSFPDPFRHYPDHLQLRLNRLCRWLDDHTQRALVMSLQRQHLIDVILKQGMKDSTREGTENKLDGNILIVAREKEDLEAWSRTFREGSAFSVLNHAMLPFKERKSLSGSVMAAQYDLVLTTYDAFKSPDVVVSLDETNHVRLPAHETTGTWCNVSQPQQGTSNKKLSFLHRLRWRKIVFTDIVGKKSYLAKAGTARQQTAVAALAQSR
jgi:hypothetical protein